MYQIKYGFSVLAGKVDVFDHFQTEDHWKLAVLRRQIVVGRAGIKLEVGISVIGLGNAFH